MSSYRTIHKRCLVLKNDDKAQGVARFFKTGFGQYGEGDIFYGINVPTLRKIASEFKDLLFDEIAKLFASPIHEERLIGVFILNGQYVAALKNGDSALQKKIYKKFFTWRKGINNWDLVDSSAPYIAGHYYFHFDSIDLEKLNKSKNLWDRRMAVVSMFYFIRQHSFSLPLKILKTRLYDKEDLMHKACGWMLREIGKREVDVLLSFLNQHAHVMPRTALRYSIERLPKIKQKDYMSKKRPSSKRASYFILIPMIRFH